MRPSWNLSARPPPGPRSPSPPAATPAPTPPGRRSATRTRGSWRKPVSPGTTGIPTGTTPSTQQTSQKPKLFKLLPLAAAALGAALFLGLAMVTTILVCHRRPRVVQRDLQRHEQLRVSLQDRVAGLNERPVPSCLPVGPRKYVGGRPPPVSKVTKVTASQTPSTLAHGPRVLSP